MDLNKVWECGFALRGGLWVKKVNHQVAVLDANHGGSMRWVVVGGEVRERIVERIN